MTTTYVNAPPALPESNLGRALSRPTRDPRSLIGLILRFISRQPAHIGKQNLATILEASNPARALGIASHRRHPAKHAVPVLPALNIYDSYAAYCKYVAVEPFTIVLWESLRDEKFPQGKNADHARLRMDTGYHVCPSPAGEPACLTRKPECVITFDEQVARAQRCLSLPKQIVSHPFAEPDGRLVIENQFVPATGRTQASIEYESLWCAKCVQYVEQGHAKEIAPDIWEEQPCTPAHEARLAPAVPKAAKGIQLDIDPVTPTVAPTAVTTVEDAEDTHDDDDEQPMKGVPLDQFHHWNKVLSEYHLSMGRLKFAIPLVFMRDLDEFGEAGGDDGRSQGVARREAVKKARRKFYAKCAHKKEQGHEAHVKAVCLWCNADIWSKEGTMFCPATDHRQMFQKYAKEDVLLDLWILCRNFGTLDTLRSSKLSRR